MRKLILIVLAISAFVSCRDDDAVTPPASTNTDYMPLKVGNYWVYQHYAIDTLGQESLLSIKDSVSIEKDTVINGDQFFVVNPTLYNLSLELGRQFLRDSSGYLITSNSRIIFSKNNFSDVLYDSTYRSPGSQNDPFLKVNYKMEAPSLSSVNVPAGTFQALNYQGTSIAYYNGLYNGNQITDTLKRFNNNYYANQVGKVLESYHYYSYSTRHTRYERRLVRYQTN